MTEHWGAYINDDVCATGAPCGAEICGDKGIYQQEAAILKAAALLRIYLGRRPSYRKPTFQAESL
jgi:hypothetical protein